MLVLATFFSICAVFVAFLLRFLFALESEVRSDQERSARVERIWTYRVPSRAVVQGQAAKLTLVHANSSPSLAPYARQEAGVRLHATQNAQMKKEA